VTPVTRRNTVEKWLAVRNPTAREIRAMDSSRAASNVTARSIRGAHHEPVRRHPGAPLKEAREVERAHVDDGPELREREVLIEVLADVVRHPPQPRQGQGAELCPGRRGPSQVVRLVMICPREPAVLELVIRIVVIVISFPFVRGRDSAEALARASVHGAPHGVEQSIAVEGLSEEGDRTGLHGAPAGFVVAVRGQDDRGNPGVRGGQMREQVEATHPGHLQIETRQPVFFR
jgi:hypothetical protein